MKASATALAFLTCFLFIATSALGAPLRGKVAAVSKDNIDQFVFLGGSLNLACYGDSGKVSQLSSKILKKGAKYSVLKIDFEIKARKRTLRMLAAFERAQSAFTRARINRTRLELSELQAAKSTCIELSLARTCKHPPCGKKVSSSTSSQGESSSSRSSSSRANSSSLPASSSVPNSSSSSNSNVFSSNPGSNSSSESFSSSGTGLTPIARWDVVPYQRINAGESLNLGVVAFSKNGIERVVFNIAGQGYMGGSKTASTMTLNPQTNVWEYWVPLAASEFTSDGPLTVEATIYGNDGGVRDETTGGGGLGLDTLNLIAAPFAQGRYARVLAWVDATSGNDSLGAASPTENGSRPFRTVAKALKAVGDYRNDQGYGGYADGGLVYLKEGTHVYGQEGIWSGGPATENEWVTITTAPDASKANTVLQSALQSAGPLFNIKQVHIKNITINGVATIICGGEFGRTASAWLDNSIAIGNGRWIRDSTIFYNYANVYYTNDDISNIFWPTFGAIIARGLTIEHIGGDAFQNIPLVVNSRVDDIDPGTTGEHSDCWQQWGGINDSNAIIYGLKCTNLHYQPIYTQGNDGANADPDNAEGIAVVNVFMQLSAVVGSGGGTQWHRGVNHFLLWNSTFIDDGNAIHDFAIGNDGSPHWAITNISISNSVFKRFLGWRGSETIDFSESSSNHYQISDGFYVTTPGSNYTIGDPKLDLDGKPQSDSPLVDKIDPPLVPVDLDGNSRYPKSDIGAYEYSPE